MLARATFPDTRACPRSSASPTAARTTACQSSLMRPCYVRPPTAPAAFTASSPHRSNLAAGSREPGPEPGSRWLRAGGRGATRKVSARAGQAAVRLEHSTGASSVGADEPARSQGLQLAAVLPAPARADGRVLQIRD